ncbi:CPXCG motif-containing cysteine-rich protein [Wenyingzhuangia sp. 2_MG-2023]|uniref:CPXCG motif-containing cysteine-rich protein n=1 Tax=Wenyingzhuangia sp. 2_MG-2023 TaxID=3062639 RepID=UPI0026E47860|nr:CPXCG motif-containing cysteine-rich protein [Wenyingzhuangia sp. 2_MG-2023]MDO6736386.1 CPXCG motif-containing cysteine-rich protein [Wenyingzhuangia sp. 2_MG-2023]
MEHHFTCPYCWETIAMQLEFSVSETYIQDCEVCCNPIELKTVWDSDALVSFEANSIGQ